MKKIILVMTCLLTFTVLFFNVSQAAPPTCYVIAGLWLDPTTAGPISQNFYIPTGPGKTYDFIYSGPLSNATNAYLKIEDVATGEKILEFSWPIPARTIHSVIFPISGHTYKVTLYDNGAHSWGARRPWVIIYR